MSNTPEHSQDSSELSPAQRLEAPNTRLINASIATINAHDALAVDPSRLEHREDVLIIFERAIAAARALDDGAVLTGNRTVVIET